MTVESVIDITDLDEKYPAQGDQGIEGDDHIRNIKKGLGYTFEGFTGTTKVLATEAEINKLAALATTAAELGHVAGVTSAIQTQLDAKADDVHTHAIADVTSLQTSLDAKSDDGHQHTASDITDLASALKIKDIQFAAGAVNSSGSLTAKDLGSVTLSNVQAGSKVILIAAATANTTGTTATVKLDITNSSDLSLMAGSEPSEIWLNSSFTGQGNLMAMAEASSPGTGSVTFKSRHFATTSANYNMINWSLIAIEVGS